MKHQKYIGELKKYLPIYNISKEAWTEIFNDSIKRFEELSKDGKKDA